MKPEIKDIIDNFNSSNLTRLRIKCDEFELELEKNNEIKVEEIKCIDENFDKILSPVIGRFCKSNVSRGANVKKGDVLCVIEAMKTFNEIYADYDCVIERILVNENDLIERNQEIMIVSKK